MTNDIFVDFSELSVTAQRIFVYVEKELFSNNTKEVHVSKAEMAWALAISIPNVKVALRELKNSKYLIPKNRNSPILSVNVIYAYRNGEEKA